MIPQLPSHAIQDTLNLDLTQLLVYLQDNGVMLLLPATLVKNNVYLSNCFVGITLVIR